MFPIFYHLFYDILSLLSIMNRSIDIFLNKALIVIKVLKLVFLFMGSFLNYNRKIIKIRNLQNN